MEKLFEPDDINLLVFLVVDNEDAYEINSTLKSIQHQGIEKERIYIIKSIASPKLSKVEEEYKIIPQKKSFDVVDCFKIAKNIGVSEKIFQVTLLRPADQWLEQGVEEQYKYYKFDNKIVLATKIQKSFGMSVCYSIQQRKDNLEIAQEEVFGAIISTDLNLSLLDNGKIYLQPSQLGGSINIQIAKPINPTMVTYSYDKSIVHTIKLFLLLFFSGIQCIFNLKPKIKILTLRLNVFKYVLYNLILLFTYKNRDIAQKRICLSINFRSNEYKNLRSFSHVTRTPLFYSSITKLKLSKRNQPFLDAYNLNTILGSLLYGLLKNVNFVYVGLPGARGVKDYLFYQSNSFTIHVSHGRNNSTKFDVSTDLAILKSDSQSHYVSAKRQLVVDRVTSVKYQKGIVVWFHGFRKGRPYGWSQFINDIVKLKNLRKIYEVKIYPHPTAHIFKLFLNFTGYQSYNPYEDLLLSCELVICGSPTMYEILSSKKLDDRILLVKDY